MLAAFGTYLKIGDGGAPENFTTILEVLDIAGPAMSVDMIDGTSHSSSGAWAEQVPSFLHGGDVTFSVNWTPTAATHNATTGLRRDFKNRTKRNFKIVWPDGLSSEDSFAAYVSAVSPAAPVADKLTQDFTLSISGPVTLV